MIGLYTILCSDKFKINLWRDLTSLISILIFVIITPLTLVQTITTLNHTKNEISLKGVTVKLYTNMKNSLRVLLALFLVFSGGAIKATDFKVPRLSPIPSNKKEFVQSLNGQWWFNTTSSPEFLANPNNSNSKHIEVPGEWLMQGFKVEKGKQAAYHRSFDVPTSWKSNLIKLRCNGIYSDAIIYVNGTEVGSHIGGFTAFEIDITPYLKWGEKNEISIGVTNESLADSLASGSQYALHTLGGISRDISLVALPQTNFALFHTSTTFDKEYKDAVLKAEVEVENESDSPQEIQFKFKLTDAKGTSISLKEAEVNLGKLSAKELVSKSFDFAVTAPHQWTSEDPYLYNLVCEIWKDGKFSYAVNRNVGFRTVEVRGNQVFVNNMPIKLRGINHHEVMPLRGRSLTGNIWEEDVRIFREANVNYFRTSHYPPDEALLEACDRLGMFVQVEAPFCWAHNTTVKPEDSYPVLINQHVEMVNRDRSHPSVIMWSLGNESMKYEEYFKPAAEVLRVLDPSRPLIFSQWGPDADNGELDITNHHYPGPGGPDKYKNSKRPVTFDEYCHVNSYNRFELSADPGVRNMWGVLLDRMWDDMYNSQGVLGGAIWAGIDDTFFVPNGGTVGYGTWGPIDGWRRPKPEYWNVKKAYSPVRIKQLGNISDEGVVSFSVENRHNFTNLSDCKIAWTAGNDNGEVSINLAPRTKGGFNIQIPSSAFNDKDLNVVITSPLGFVIDEYSFQYLPVVGEKKIAEHKGKLKVTQEDNQLLISTSTNQFSLNKRSGLFNVKNQKGTQTLVSASPTLMLLPLNSQGRGIQMVGDNLDFEPFNPTCTNWITSNITWDIAKEQVVITVEGAYAEAKGEFTYTVLADGTLSIGYEFEVEKEVNPRQVGLVFNLPKDFTTLSWQRKGYWSVYPTNHLGALSGTAVAFNSDQPMVQSAGPSAQPSLGWEFDQNEAGSNLFRATKENIYWAELTNAQGNEIKVDSDSSQSFRAWMDVKADAIKMLVADYNNAGMEGFLSSHAEKDYKPLKRGDIVKGNIVLNIK